MEEIFAMKKILTTVAFSGTPEQEAKLDYDALLEEAWLTRNTLVAEPFSL